ncbi:dTDP-4-dehydrorhamnose 3,5-epimerase [Amycolatopsis bartoniae]|uniref:dTDP-4-dehydrorhamnose 3,5-epimerase n=1 Tax=Amycolatopsis bartoniae TaxID=941986 RepID=A0A8H9M946_9PSEU|nr:dTDP-4-dehydrorhamnose 3,5-epimerase [Amycolatopsis bartoniae]MBB2934534.1 dTDP-4-dehydrorhamnose 3,5-epimerase [Amycolatopsis bartoniae]TVT06871.1 dTDP-4-keto-6-deoxy-D-glucose epimerase [Amycolatopsis bartoniae]GHF46661.1 dTDP-4-dehydrorhamnose 3,5-epimerase [Amycolatopsis bartoniae]
MKVRELAVKDAYEFTPQQFPDNRGLFVAPLQEPALVEAVGHPMHLAQTNHSVSRRGTIRGLHFADTPPGQAKYVYCPSGALLDVVVDLRVGSPTFGRWDAVRLDSVDFRAVYIAEGLGHGFVALEDNTAMSYLCSTGYNPGGEHGITPLDPALDLPWPEGIERILSEKDASAPTLAEAEAAGLLPSYAACVAHYASLS